MGRIPIRLIHLVMALYLAASGVELLDRSGLAGEETAVAETAETLRQIRAGDDPLGLIAEVRQAIDALRSVGNAFTEAGNALS